MEFLFLFVIPLAAFLGLWVGWLMTETGWHLRGRHKCGWHSKHYRFLDVCPRCGAAKPEMEVRTGRGTLLFGVYEWAKPKVANEAAR